MIVRTKTFLHSFLTDAKNQKTELRKILERYCKVLAVFAFDSEKNALKLIKSFCYLILLTNEILNILLSKTRTRSSF